MPFSWMLAQAAVKSFTCKGGRKKTARRTPTVHIIILLELEKILASDAFNTGRSWQQQLEG